MEKLKQKANATIAYKSVSTKFDRPSPENRIVKGYLSAFNNVDSDMDVIRPGAFAKSIEERGVRSTSNRKIKFLHQHMATEPCGVLLELKEDDFGLYFESQIERTPLGDVVLERYANGTYTEHSIGFKYVWNNCGYIQMPIPGHDDLPPLDVFECKELNLFEGSVVTWGANMNTPFLGFKGTKEDIFKQLNSEIEFLIKKAPNYEYELEIRRLFQKQFSLIESLAGNTGDKHKPEPQGINYESLIKNLKL